ncbi:DUF6223 family protein [Actinomadura fulvescens]|uniref:Integral membrane protein n=1 Tax=Actinomadura fulvescens TaxID=46160 RepID=A0ABN3QKB2_9ACTN
MPVHFAAAAVSTHPVAASFTTMTANRTTASIAALIGLAGLVIGGLALARSSNAQKRTVIALSAGVISIVLGGLVVATADGGLGTGNGLGGGIVAMAVGVLDLVVGGLALTRSRRSAVKTS